MPRARKDVVLPFSKPVIGEDGRSLSDVFLPAGTMVMIAIMNANRNKEIWGEDAGEWKPERWLAPLPETVAEAKVVVPSAEVRAAMILPRKVSDLA